MFVKRTLQLQEIMLANNNFRITQKAQQTVLNGPEEQILYINQ